MANKLNVKVPGKLMVAGEFAVLEPYEPLLVMAVDRFVYADLEDASVGALTLESFGLHEMEWVFTDSELQVQSEDDRVTFVAAAMETALRYVSERGISLSPFHLSIRSELDDGAGRKYGLGSSAAVSVAVVGIILEKYLGEMDPFLVFQLASISHVSVQGNGSGADIAASSYGGILRYTSFQADWLLDRIAQASTIRDIVEVDWKYASIKQMALPDGLDIYVGWTGSPASTGNLVGQILQLKETNPLAFRAFLQGSREAVEACALAMVQGDIDQVLANIRKNRKVLTSLGKAANVAIDTPALDRLSDITEDFGGAGKFSGAGGGDCGLAFVKQDQGAELAKRLFAAWRAASIEPLTIQLYDKGIESFS